MSGCGPHTDPRVQKTLKLIEKAPILNVPQAMRAAGFSNEESLNRTKQMWIRRRMPSTRSISTKVTPTSIHSNSSPATTVSSITTPPCIDTAFSESSATKLKCPPPQPKQQRKTASAKQQQRLDKRAAAKHYSHSQKRATSWYLAEKTKENGLSAKEVARRVVDEYGVGPSPRIIQRYVHDNLAGASSLKKGARGSIPDRIYNNLLAAFESYIRINQLNGAGGDNTKSKLAARVNRVVGNKSPLSFKLLDRLLRDTAVDLSATKMNCVEERRIQWTTYKNLKMWFANWKHDLEELGFVKRDDNGNPRIIEDQLTNIINFDETCLSLGGSNGNRGTGKKLRQPQSIRVGCGRRRKNNRAEKDES